MTDIIEKKYQHAKLLAKDYAVSLMANASFGQSLIAKNLYEYGWVCKPEYWRKMVSGLNKNGDTQINIKSIQDIIDEHGIDIHQSAKTPQLASLAEEDAKEHLVASYLINTDNIPIACIFEMDEEHPSCWVYLAA